MNYPFVLFCKNPEVHSSPSCYSSLSILSIPFAFCLYRSLSPVLSPLTPCFSPLPLPSLPTRTFFPDSPAFPVRRVPPRFSILPSNHEIMPHGSVNITCVAVGSPMPYVKWMLGSEDLTPEDEMPIGRNVLELNGVRESANYTCVAMSSLGIIEATAQVLVKCKEYAFCISPMEGLVLLL